MSEADLQKYLAELKVLVIGKYKDAYRYAAPRFLFLSEKAIKHKETIIKAIIPFGFIALGFYACNSSHDTVVKNVSDIFEISDEIRNNYAKKPDYWGLSTQIAIHEDYVPKRFIKNGKIVISGGDEIFIGDGEKADTIMPRTTSFDIVLPNLNKAQCIAHAEAPISQENQVKLLRISIVNSLGTYSFEWGNGRYRLPIAKYASKDICNTSDNILIWSIK